MSNFRGSVSSPFQSQRQRRVAASTALLLAALIQSGCYRAHFAVQSAPVPAEQAASFKTASPEVPAVVQVANFAVGAVDTQYTEEEKESFRKHFAVAIANLLQETLGRKQIFSNVTRSVTPMPAQAEFVVSGSYDFFERLGTGGREWIPFYGTFGGKINEAWVKGTITVVVTDSRSGTELLRKTYVEEHRDRTSVYQKPFVGYLQADFLSNIASEIIAAGKAARPSTGAAGNETGNGKVKTPIGLPLGSTAERLKKLDALQTEGLLSSQEYQQRRSRILDEAIGQ